LRILRSYGGELLILIGSRIFFIFFISVSADNAEAEDSGEKAQEGQESFLACGGGSMDDLETGSLHANFGWIQAALQKCDFS
jgi:hypothetical protein